MLSFWIFRKSKAYLLEAYLHFALEVHWNCKYFLGAFHIFPFLSSTVVLFEVAGHLVDLQWVNKSCQSHLHHKWIEVRSCLVKNKLPLCKASENNGLPMVSKMSCWVQDSGNTLVKSKLFNAPLCRTCTLLPSFLISWSSVIICYRSVEKCPALTYSRLWR